MTSAEPIELSPLKSRGRRCPWYRDVLDLAAAPRAPYQAWRGTALVFAGTEAWALAEAARTNARRAVTLLPPGADPSSMRWPSVQSWVGDCGDLDSGNVVRLAQVLAGSGAMRVTLLSKNIEGGIVNLSVVA